jgi:transposase
VLSAFEKAPYAQALRALIPRFLRAVFQLKQVILPQLVTLGETLATWSQEIADTWRFTRNKGTTEGFHTPMEILQRQAYGLPQPPPIEIVFDARRSERAHPVAYR